MLDGWKVLGALLIGMQITSLHASTPNACHKSMIQLHEVKELSEPLDALRARLELDEKKVPNSWKTKPKEWGRKLSECFRSPKLSAKQRRTAQVNLAMGTLVPLTAILASHTYSVNKAREEKTEAPDFPFDLLATSISMNAWTALIQCKNELMNGNNPDKSWVRQKFENYMRYFWMNVAGAGVYTGFIAAEDAIRGENIFASDNLSEYGKEAMFGFAWDSSTDFVHVLILDKVLMKYLPGGRAMITDLVRKGVFRGKWLNAGSKRFLRLQAQDWAKAPGLLVEFLVRQGYVSARAFSYVQIRNSLFAPGGTEDVDELGEADLSDFLPEIGEATENGSSKKDDPFSAGMF